MQYNTLGDSDVLISRICLGTMTFGEQNSEEEAHEQLDYAIDQGINFIDTAELYPVPARAHTYGLTEKYIGTWLASRQNREKIILASKIAGFRKDAKYIRGGSQYTPEQLTEALDNSLQRLQTDYIDLYQLHWPERKTNFFGKLGYKHQSHDTWEDNFLDILQVLQSFIKEGKVRSIGLSNETPWGVSRFIELAKRYDLPKIVSVQNPYNLLNRTYEIGLAEISIREKVGLLAYSPMAFGLLSGKYFDGEQPGNARISLYPEMSRYSHPLAMQTAEKYCRLARDNGLSPAQMALAYINSREFLTSNIIGATSMQQLEENINSIHITLPENLLEEIESIHTSQPNPAP
jgi:aryl-alcohol dehydrogenase-like predicted oxidoreductase